MTTNNKQLSDIARDPWIIRGVLQTPENCLAAVQADGMVLKFIKPENQTELICLEAVLNHGYALQFVHNQTQKIIRVAIEKHGFAIKFVNPAMLNDDLIYELVNLNYNIIYMIECTEEVWMDVFTRKPKLANSLPTRFNNPEFVSKLVKANPEVIQYIDQTEELCRLALSANLNLWEHCRYQPDDLMNKVYDYSPNLFSLYTHVFTSEYFVVSARKDPRYAAFAEPSFINQTRMIRNNPETLRFINCPHQDIVKHAIITDPNNIKYVDKQTAELQSLAMALDPTSCKYFILIEKPDQLDQKIADATSDKIPNSECLRNLTIEIIQNQNLTVEKKADLLMKLCQL